MCTLQVRKGFWKPPPQIWLGDVSKIRVLDPHFLHQTADRLLRIPLHPKSKQVSDHFHFTVLWVMKLGLGSGPHQIVALSKIVGLHLCFCCSSLILTISGVLSWIFPLEPSLLFAPFLPYLPFFSFCPSLLPTWMLTRLDGASTD